jgi:hypothetical protein
VLRHIYVLFPFPCPRIVQADLKRVRERLAETEQNLKGMRASKDAALEAVQQIE